MKYRKYRRKPIEVQAVQWLGWDKGPQIPGIRRVADPRTDPTYGEMTIGRRDVLIKPGDWIVTDSWGLDEIVKADDFAAEYEPVEEPGEGVMRIDNQSGWDRFLPRRTCTPAITGRLRNEL